MISSTLLSLVVVPAVFLHKLPCEGGLLLPQEGPGASDDFMNDRDQAEDQGLEPLSRL